MEVRPTRRADIPAVDALLARAYPVLLKPDYPPSVLVTALPLISRAQPALVTCGTYYGVFEGDTLLGAGGWTMAAPGGARQHGQTAHIRHVVTDPNRTREGIASTMMDRVLGDARAAGATCMACQSTRTAVPFYGAIGFSVVGEIVVPLRGGIDFPAVQMKLEF